MVSLLVSITLKPLPCMGFLLVILVVRRNDRASFKTQILFDLQSYKLRKI
jgi:hypothetical protein